MITASTRRAAGALGLLFASACAEQAPLTPMDVPQSPAPVLARIDCRVARAPASLVCSAAQAGAGGARATILGGQGVYVRLTSTGTKYDADTQLLTSNVTVQNLVASALGTADGTTPGQVRVFFASGPTVVAGTGEVEVDAPDGLETFTAANQPYYAYPGILPPLVTSAPRLWGFRTPPTVDSFVFTVYVEGPLAAEDRVMRWAVERGPIASEDLMGIWASDANHMFAAGSSILFFNGVRWTLMDTGTATPNLESVYGIAPNDVYASGYGVWHYDGRSWTQIYMGGGEGIWVAPNGDLFVGGFGQVHRRVNGTWSVDNAAPGRVEGVWGAAVNDVWVATDSGVVSHWDGSSWTMTRFSGFGHHFYTAWGTGPNDVYAAGTNGEVAHWNGSAWTLGKPVSYSSQPYWSAIGGTGPNDVYLAGSEGKVAHWNGTSWSTMDAGSGNWTGIWAFPDGTVQTVGYGGTTGRRVNGQWTVMSSSTSPLIGLWARDPQHAIAVGSDGTAYRLAGDGVWTAIPAVLNAGNFYAVWAPEDSVAFGVGWYGMIQRLSGTTWTRMTSPTGKHVRSVWGTSKTDVWAGTDDGAILHYNGTVWSISSPADSLAPVRKIDGTGPNDVTAYGATLRHWDGTRWTSVATYSGLAAQWQIGPREWRYGDNNGKIWRQPPAGSPVLEFDNGGEPIVRVAGYGTTYGYAFGWYGGVWAFDGTRWTRMQGGAGPYIHAATVFSNGEVLAVGEGGMIVRGTR